MNRIYSHEMYLNSLRKFIITKQFTATKYIKRIVKILCDARNLVNFITTPLKN